MNRFILTILYLSSSLAINVCKADGIDHSQLINVLESNRLYGAANTLRVADRIYGIEGAENLKEVEDLFKQGESFWLNSEYVQKDLQSTTGDVYYFDLVNSVTSYFTNNKQRYLSIPYIRKGMDAAYAAGKYNQYFVYASNLNQLYVDFGLFNQSWDLLGEVLAHMDDLYQYETFEKSKNSFDLLSVHFSLLKLKMDTVIASNNLALLSIEDLRTEYSNLLKAYEADVRLEFFDFTFANARWMVNAKGRSKSELEKVHYYTNMGILKDFQKLFSMYGEKDYSLKALKKLDENYSANIRQKYSIEKNAVYEAYLENREKFVFSWRSTETIEADHLRFPLENEFWMHANSIQLLLLTNENEKAFNELQVAQKAMDALLDNYSKLDDVYKELDHIDKDIYEFQMLQAAVHERTNRLAEASKLYTTIIATNEDARTSIPVQMRKNFFNGMGKNAYLGLIRVNTLLYEKVPTQANFEKILGSINNINARQLKELSEGYNVDNKINLAEIQNKLAENDLIYVLFDVDNAIAIATISKYATNAKLFNKGNDFDNLLTDFKDQLVLGYRYDDRRMKQISSTLFDQLNGYKGIKNLHILSDGIMSILPFDIYQDTSGRMLFENYTIDYLSTLNVNQSARKQLKSDVGFLGVADPQYKNEKVNSNLFEYFVALPETREEVVKISTLFESKKLLLGVDANESAIEQMDLTPFSYIHFATHGILGGELKDVNEPALVLSAENGEDGLLTSSEVAKLKLNSDITVLSACNTGSGKYFRGEGLSGIGRAFKIAGSRNLLVSLWPVDSISTQKLMENFYSNVKKGNGFASALHLAKQSLMNASYPKENTQRSLKLKSKTNISNNLDGYKNPYFWSAFILIGG